MNIFLPLIITGGMLASFGLGLASGYVIGRLRQRSDDIRERIAELEREREQLRHMGYAREISHTSDMPTK